VTALTSQTINKIKKDNQEPLKCTRN